jgi:hypothetical protein
MGVLGGRGADEAEVEAAVGHEDQERAQAPHVQTPALDAHPVQAVDLARFVVPIHGRRVLG